MHRELRQYLTDAEGLSDLVVVVFLDVRGFSTFAGMAESSEAAIFLRNMYLQIIDNYFPEAVFFKPTGDGLMIILHVDKETLDHVVNDAVSKSLTLVESFDSISDSDPMVNFDVPDQLGIGITRGAATRLASGGKTLDYSGRPLNLAARLMDLARPSGVVVDGRAVKGVTLAEELRGSFTTDNVYVKGIADLQPIEVLRSQHAIIRYANRHPLLGKPYEQRLPLITSHKMKELGKFIHKLDQEPVDPDSVILEVQIPMPDKSGKKTEIGGIVRLEPVEVRRTASGWDLAFNYREPNQFCQDNGVRTTWGVHRRLRYSVADLAQDESTDATTDTGGVS